MDVIQNVTNIFTADLLKSSIGSPTTNAVVAPYFMIPLVVVAYIATTTPKYLSDGQYNSKNLVLLEKFTEPWIQYKYGESLRQISDSRSAKVLNKLFIRDTQRLTSNVETVANRVGFDLEYLDMTYRYVARQHIESYIKDHGYNNTKLPPSSQLKDTQIILLNGVEFQSEWEYPFDIKYHKWIRFWTEEYRYKVVKAMHFEAVFPYAEYCDMRIVVVPYNNQDNSLALMIVLPNTIGSLHKNILNQNFENYQQKILNTQFEFQNVNVDVPIFTLEEKTQVTNVLYKMGFGRLFGSKVALDNFLTTRDPIRLDNVDHHVLISVNGTVTSPDCVVNHCPPKSARVIDFKVNRPFLFYILDMETRVPYFSGLVNNLEGKSVVDHSKELEIDKKYDDITDCRKI